MAKVETGLTSARTRGSAPPVHENLTMPAILARTSAQRPQQTAMVFMGNRIDAYPDTEKKTTLK